MKTKNNRLLICLVMLLCILCSIVLVSCKDKPAEETAYVVKFVDFDGTPIGVKLHEEDIELVYEQQVAVGQAAIAPANPTREGYEFKGWDKDFSSVKSDLTITATYEKLEYFNVSFLDFDRTPIGVKLKDDDDTLTYVQSVSKNTSAKAPINPTREGYEFRGWNKDYTSVTSDLEIMAQYTQVCEVIFWNDNEIYEVRTVEYGKDAELPLVDPVKIGYRFDHWNGKYTNVIANTSVYAVFVKQYSVTFIGYSGTEIDTQLVDENGAAVAPIPPLVDGYVFDKWDKDFSNVTSNLTVNAIYKEASSFNVTFVDYDDSVLKEERVYKGDSATAPDMVGHVYADLDSQTKQGYVFDKWDKEYSNITSDLTIKAEYKEYDSPILFVKSAVVKKGTTNYATVSIYVVSSIEFKGLDLSIGYATQLGLVQDNISIKNDFSTQGPYVLNLDTSEKLIEFSCTKMSQDGYVLTDNYAKIMDIKFEIDDYLSIGKYPVEILADSIYVDADYMQQNPAIISGCVEVEEV